ncbi:MAG TPA: HAMP domain-containing histidine kinase [Candidatus Blautia merdipullorum]|nr:HAMP domain-containing histidine kinase [Candidatus Blautia merdipullorum]
MEIVLLMGILLLLGLAAFLLWKIHMLKQDIYGFTKNLDMALNIMLNGEKLESRPYSEDDLWGMIYERLRELSNMYTHKNKEISEEKELLKELVSDISHQTKTPIANVKLYLEMMGEDKENIPEYMKKLNLQVDKLDFLLQSMVKISRLETGTIKIQKQKLPIARTLAESIAAVVPKADKKKIQIFVECEENLAVEHDKKWTGEALFNILDNAVKYTQAEGRVYISVCRQEIFTRISIKDTGKGIALERRGAVFNRFYREPEIHDSEGIGIGLYLARKIITMQNGYIELESQAGRGSTFKIYLPNTD